MAKDALGKTYDDGEVIVRQGDELDYMYVVQEGQVEILREVEGGDVHLSVLEEGGFFGSVPFFERRNKKHEGSRTTARAVGSARSLTVDSKTILRRIHEDPSLAYRLLQLMSKRMNELEDEVARIVAAAMESIQEAESDEES
jgi:CRP/FNR family transcriptional regulator, cyclic AMP receptor protein